MNRAIFRAMICLFLALCLAAIVSYSATFAQGSGDSTAPTPAASESAQSDEGISLWDTVKDGGIIGLIIILLSIATLALVIEHFISIRRDVLVPPTIMTEVQSLFEAKNYQGALNLCRGSKSFLAKVLEAGLSNMRGGSNGMEAAMQEAGADETAKLYRKIDYLALIGNVAPMLGLLGTVVGMIVAFNTIAVKEFAKPPELAAGIRKALVTTCEGLIVAIPTMCAFVFFRNRIATLVSEVAVVTEELMKRLKSK